MKLGRFLFNGLILLLFVLAYGPFFGNFVPFIDYDSFLYYLVVDAWINDSMLLDLITLDLPLGYPYFLLAVEEFGFSKVTITIIQLLTFITPFILLLNKIFSSNRIIAFCTLFSSFTLFFSNDWIVHSVTFKPDFLFTSVILWITYLIYITKDWGRKSIIILSLLIAAGISIRSNGLLLVAFYLIPLLEGRALFKQRFKFILASGLLINLFLVLVSFSFVGYPSHGSLLRLYQTFTNQEILKNRAQVREPRLDIADKYFNPLKSKQTYFYNTEIRNLMGVIYFNGHFQSKQIVIHRSKGKKYFPFSTVKLTIGLKDLSTIVNMNTLKKRHEYLSPLNTIDLPINHKLAIKLQQYQRYLYPVLKLLYSFLIVFSIVFLIRQYFFNRIYNWKSGKLLFLLTFHLFSIIFLIFFHPRFVMRYAMPTETIMFLIAPLMFLQLIKDFKCLKTKQ